MGTCEGYTKNGMECQNTTEHPYRFCEDHLDERNGNTMAANAAIEASLKYRKAIEHANDLLADLQLKLNGLSPEELDQVNAATTRV